MCDIGGCAGGTDHVHVAGNIVRLGSTGPIAVMQALLRDNDHRAEYHRQHFDAAGVLVVNLMSPPGAGKTSLLEAAIRTLHGRLSAAVIEGDLETGNDARRIRATGARPASIPASRRAICKKRPSRHRCPNRRPATVPGWRPGSTGSQPKALPVVMAEAAQ